MALIIACKTVAPAQAGAHTPRCTCSGIQKNREYFSVLSSNAAAYGSQTRATARSGMTSGVCSRSTPKTWMNPMRPVFIGVPIPLPRPNHPKQGTLGVVGPGERDGPSIQTMKRHRRRLTKYQEDLSRMTAKRLVFPCPPPYLQREFVKPARVAGKQGKYKGEYSNTPDIPHG